MPTLPDTIIAILTHFAPLFSTPVFRHVQVLLAGAILTPGRHTVTNALRLMGLAQVYRFQNFHRVLNRAKWDEHRAAKILLRLLVTTFAPTGTIVVGIDETLERRQGKKIKAKGIYRDAARSSRKFLVKSSGLRWVCLMLLAPIPWAKRVWAMPFFSLLAPSERYDQERGRRHKTLAQWAIQMVIQLRRWLPKRHLVVVGDSNYSVLELLNRCTQLKNPVVVVTRLRLDAALYEPTPPRREGQMGRPRKSGKRLPTLQQVTKDEQTAWYPVIVPRWYGQSNRPVEIVSATCLWYHRGQTPVPIRYVLIRDLPTRQRPFDTQALLCTDVSADPVEIVSWFVQRWQMEETFQEVRTHLGVETQRQWNDLAILRTTPALLGLFSLITLMADHLKSVGKLSVRSAAWYPKEQATFSDAIAAVRREIWRARLFGRSSPTGDTTKLSGCLVAVMESMQEALCYPA